MTGRRVGVFGGTFDPIHVGHLAAAEDAAWILALDSVLLVPNNVPPHKLGRSISHTADRLAMVRAAAHGNALFEVSEIEVERAGPSYTLDTMRQLRHLLPDDNRLVFLAGRDALSELHMWYEPEALLKEFEIVFLSRPDGRAVDWEQIEGRFPHLRTTIRLVDIPQLEISGSDIRSRVREGRPIKYYVTPPVEAYILEHGLYR